MICPHCGCLIRVTKSGLTFKHNYEGVVCPGARQYPRCAESDGRPLWNGKSNTYFYGNQGA